MEKYSAYRDPGTGIQPFLTPIPPSNPSLAGKLLLPLGYVIATLRTSFILLLAALYILLVRVVLIVFYPIPPVYRPLSHALTALLCRAALFTIGLVWIPTEIITRKRGRGAKPSTSWSPKAGDIIVSNWVSWTEVLWLTFRFNPIFVVPIPASPALSEQTQQAAPIAFTPGRRTGTGSANIAAVRAPSQRVPISGFTTVSLFQLIHLTGHVPPYGALAGAQPRSLEEIRSKAARPVVVFPEGTTSNGRGLLRFANMFEGITVPPKKFEVFVICVRYDPPTTYSPSLAHCIPSAFNPLPHIFHLCTSFFPQSISIRLLSTSDSPSSPLFVVSEMVTGEPGEDQLAECCAALVAQLGKMKRTASGWEDKASFLTFYNKPGRGKA